MKSVLVGFLGTYTSRYSDYRGYWLHGQLPFNCHVYEFDLLGSPTNNDVLAGFAWRLANRRFEEQVIKAGLSMDAVSEATLRIRMLPETINARHGDRMSDGHTVQFEASAIMDKRYRFEKRQAIFVAPHNPNKERRRLPDEWGT